MLLHRERCSAPGKAALQFAAALAGKRSVRFVVTSIIPNLGHVRKRCQKPVLITPLRVARTQLTSPESKRPRCPGDLPKGTQLRRPPVGRTVPSLQKKGTILLITRRVLGFSKASGRSKLTREPKQIDAQLGK